MSRWLHGGIPSAKESALAGGKNKRALCELVSSSGVPGPLGCLGTSPVAWISLGHREDYLKLRRSPIMKRVPGSGKSCGAHRPGW